MVDSTCLVSRNKNTVGSNPTGSTIKGQIRVMADMQEGFVTLKERATRSAVRFRQGEPVLVAASLW